MEKLNLSERIPSTAQSYDAVDMAKIRVDTYNLLPGEDKLLDCPKCLGKGTVAVLRQDGSMAFQDCSCQNMRRMLARMERSGLGKAVWDMTFRKFEATRDWQKKLKAGAMAYSRKPEGWFFICGQSGCGKTHLCTAICRNQFSKGTLLEYMSWREETGRLKALNGEDEQRQLRLQKLKTTQLLYIDDLFKTGSPEGGTGRPTASDLNIAFEILNHRYINRLPTIISTELQLHEIIALDEAIAGRIAELAGKHIYSVSSDRERNYRLRNLICV